MSLDERIARLEKLARACEVTGDEFLRVTPAPLAADLRALLADHARLRSAIEVLREASEKATAGPFTARMPPHTDIPDVLGFRGRLRVGTFNKKQDAAFIALAVNTIRTLLEEKP